MRAYQILLALGIAISTQHARESGSPPIRTAPAATEASIPLPIPDGAPAAPPKPVEKPVFRIEGTQVRERLAEMAANHRETGIAMRSRTEGGRP